VTAFTAFVSCIALTGNTLMMQPRLEDDAEPMLVILRAPQRPAYHLSWGSAAAIVAALEADPNAKHYEDARPCRRRHQRPRRFISNGMCVECAAEDYRRKATMARQALPEVAILAANDVHRNGAAV
jgi:hypothetical protein